MGVTLERVQFKFASIIGELCSEPDILSQFAVWVDLRLAEYKLKGHITLECDGDTPDPLWLKGILSALLQKKFEERRADVKSPPYTHKCPCLQDASNSSGDTSCVVGISEHRQDRCGSSDKDSLKASAINKPRYSQQAPGCHEGSTQNFANADVQEASSEEESVCVFVKKGPQDEDIFVVVPPGNQSELDISSVNASSDSCETSVNDKVESDSRSEFEERESPNHQSLMSIIGKTLPDANFPSDAIINVKNNTNTKIPSASQNIQVGKSPSGGILSSSLLLQVPVSPIAKTQGSLVNALSSLQTGINIGSISLQSTNQPGVSSVKVPVKRSLPFGPGIALCNPAITNLNGGQVSVPGIPNKDTSSNHNEGNRPEDRKRKLKLNASQNTHIAKSSSLKKTKLSTEKPLIVGSIDPPASATPTSSPSSQARPRTVWSGLKCAVPHLSSNQVSLRFDQGKRSSPNLSLTKGQKVSIKYPMKRRTAVTRYRPILPADSGIKYAGPATSISRTIT